MQKNLEFGRESFLILAAVIATGILAGMTDSIAAFVVLALCGMVLASLMPPLTLFLLWLFLAPFTQAQVVRLGGGIPAISLDRAIFIFLIVKLLVQTLSKKSLGTRLKLEDGLLLAFLAWALVSILIWRRIDLPAQFIALTVQFLYPIGIYWAVQQVITSESDLKKVMFTVTLLLIILGAPTILETITGLTPLGYAASVENSVIRVRSFLRTAWEFGAVVVMMFMYNLHLLTYRSGRKLTTLGLFGLLFGACGLLLSFMRGAWLAAFISTAVVFIFAKNLRRFIYPILLCAILVVIFLGPVLINSTAWSERITETGNVVGRLNVTQQQIKLITDEPFLGNGLLPNFETYVMTTLYYDTGSYDVMIISHNTLLSMFVDFGLFALLFIGAISVILYKAILNFARFPVNTFLGQGLLLALGSSVLAFLINALTFENRVFIFINAFAWMTLGLIKVAIRLNAERLAAVDTSANSLTDLTAYLLEPAGPEQPQLTPKTMFTIQGKFLIPAVGETMQNRIRVALGSVYPVSASIINNGVEAVAYYLSRGMALSPEVEVHVVSCSPLVSKDHVEIRGNISIHWIKSGKRFYNIRANTLDAWKVRQVYQSIHPDIIHAQAFAEYGIAVQPSQKLILSIHGIEAFSKEMKRVQHFRGLPGLYRNTTGKILATENIRKACGIIANAGEYTIKDIPELTAGKKIFYIANPIIPDFFNIARNTSKKHNGCALLWVGTISERKNTLHLINIFAQLVRDYPDTTLTLVGPVGEPWYYEQLLHAVQELKIGANLKIAGTISQDELIEKYTDADIFLFPSIEESAPMVIAQAMAAGLPVIASRVGGIPWMLDDGQAGLVADPGDSAAWLQSISRLIESEHERAEIGLKAKNRARLLFDPATVAQQTVAAYRELLA